jgi:hypothetical protein
MAEAGRLVLLLGVVLLIVGGVMMLFGRFSLPGDISYRRGNFTLFAPIGTMLLISIVLTILLNVFLRIGR